MNFQAIKGRQLEQTPGSMSKNKISPSNSVPVWRQTIVLVLSPPSTFSSRENQARPTFSKKHLNVDYKLRATRTAGTEALSCCSPDPEDGDGGEGESLKPMLPYAVEAVDYPA